MEVLHHPAVQAFHWICSIAMVGIALDPTGFGATVGNYVAHIGDGLGNLFNGAAGAETLAHAGHGTAAAATTTTAATASAHTAHTAISHAAHSSAVAGMPDLGVGIETDVHAHHDFSEAAAAAPEAVNHAFESRSEWFESLSEAKQAEFESNAKMLGMSVEEYTRGFCGTGIPGNWSPM